VSPGITVLASGKPLFFPMFHIGLMVGVDIGLRDVRKLKLAKVWYEIAGHKLLGNASVAVFATQRLTALQVRQELLSSECKGNYPKS